MNIDLRFQDWSLVLAGASVRQYDDRAQTVRVTGDLPAGWRWKLYASVFSEAYFNAIPLSEADGELTAVLTRDDLAFGDTTYTLQLVGEQDDVRRHTNPVRLYVGASISGDGVWPEVPRSFTDAEAAALAAAERAETAAERAAGACALEQTLSAMLIPILAEGLYGTDQTAAISALEAALGSGGVTMHSITNNLTNVTNSNGANAVVSGAAYSATLTPASGMELSEVSVTMGGSDITSTAYSNGAITIASVTGDVVITAVAESIIETYTPTMIAGYYIVANGTEYDHSAYQRTPVIPCRAGDKVYGTCENSSYPGIVVNYIRARWTAAYDNNGTAIDSAGSNTQYDYSQSSPYVVPSGVYGVVFSMVNALANNVVVYVDKSERVGA